MNLFEYKELIDLRPIHIATVNKENNPNLSVASDGKVIGNDKILISVNEMVNTQENIKYNSNVVLTAFDENYEGLRMFGTAEYFTEIPTLHIFSMVSVFMSWSVRIFIIT